MGAPRGVAPPPHRTHSGQTAAKSPPTLGTSGHLAEVVKQQHRAAGQQSGCTSVAEKSRREASLGARVAGSDAPARGGWRRPHGDGGGADGEGGRRQRQRCEWAGLGAVAQNGRASRWSKPRAPAGDAGRCCGIVTDAAGGHVQDGRAGGGEGSWLAAVYLQCNNISRGAVRRGGQGRAKRFEIQALI